MKLVLAITAAVAGLVLMSGAASADPVPGHSWAETVQPDNNVGPFQ